MLEHLNIDIFNNASIDIKDDWDTELLTASLKERKRLLIYYFEFFVNSDFSEANDKAKDLFNYFVFRQFSTVYLSLFLDKYSIEDIFDFIESRTHHYVETEESIDELAEQILIHGLKKELRVKPLLKLMYKMIEGKK